MNRERLPSSFVALAALLSPKAISSAAQHGRSMKMIDRLMAVGRLTKGQQIYLQTLVQLVEAYEAKRHLIDTSRISGIDSLRHLLDLNGMSAADLGRLLGVHPSMGSKILNGDRSLTVGHLRVLANRFKVSPVLFIDDCEARA